MWKNGEKIIHQLLTPDGTNIIITSDEMVKRALKLGYKEIIDVKDGLLIFAKTELAMIPYRIKKLKQTKANGYVVWLPKAYLRDHY